MRSRFDGRGRVELLPVRTTAAQQRRTEEIAHALGYRLLAVHNLGFVGLRLDFERDDTPVARRCNALTIARLRAGGPVLPAVEPPAPPPPAPPPTTSPRGRRRVQPSSGDAPAAPTRGSGRTVRSAPALLPAAAATPAPGCPARSGRPVRGGRSIGRTGRVICLSPSSPAGLGCAHRTIPGRHPSRSSPREGLRALDSCVLRAPTGRGPVCPYAPTARPRPLTFLAGGPDVLSVGGAGGQVSRGRAGCSRCSRSVPFPGG